MSFSYLKIKIAFTAKPLWGSLRHRYMGFVAYFIFFLAVKKFDDRLRLAKLNKLNPVRFLGHSAVHQIYSRQGRFLSVFYIYLYSSFLVATAKINMSNKRTNSIVSQT